MSNKSNEKPTVGGGVGNSMDSSLEYKYNVPEEVYLEEDILKTPGQNYALVSFVSPESAQKFSKIAMKIRGVFGTLEEARQHCDRVMKTDPKFDVFVVQMYNWVVVPPDREMIEDEVYQEEFLNNMMKEYKENRVLAQQHFQERKHEMMNRPDVNKELNEKRLEEEEKNNEKNENENENVDEDASAGEMMKEMETDNHPSATQE